MTIVDLRTRLVLLILGLYLILNNGFMLVRVPPVGASGVPVGEILLILFAAMIVGDVKFFPAFARAAPLAPLLIWWALGLGRAVFAVPEHGMWALRDATHVIESLYLWVGFVIAASHGFFDRFFAWLRTVVTIGVVYGLSYPLRETLQALSPKIQAAAGYSTSIFFHYHTTNVLMFLAAVRELLRVPRSHLQGYLSWLFASGLIGFVVVFLQARTNYLMLFGLFLLLAWTRRAASSRMGMAILMGLFGFVTLSALGIEIEGRLGQKFSIDFLINHFAAIWGAEAEGVEGAAQGVGLRLGWYSLIWDRLTESPWTFLIGLGHGEPLIDFAGLLGVTVREPHNSLMSIVGRMGAVGLIAFLWGHVFLVRAWMRTYRICGLEGDTQNQNRLIIVMAYFVLIWIYTIGEDAFEKPYNTIPYYFFWGVVLRMYFERVVSVYMAAPIARMVRPDAMQLGRTRGSRERLPR